MLSCFTPALIQAGAGGLEEKTVAQHEHYLFHANLDLISLTEKMDQFAPDEAAPAQAAGNYVIDRIEFTGNRRIRTDTLKPASSAATAIPTTKRLSGATSRRFGTPNSSKT